MPQLNGPCKPQGEGREGKHNTSLIQRSYHQLGVDVLHHGTAGDTLTLLSLTKEYSRSLNDWRRNQFWQQWQGARHPHIRAALMPDGGCVNTAGGPRGESRINRLPGCRLGFLALPVRLCERQVAQEVAHERVPDDALRTTRRTVLQHHEPGRADALPR